MIYHLLVYIGDGLPQILNFDENIKEKNTILALVKEAFEERFRSEIKSPYNLYHVDYEAQNMCVDNIIPLQVSKLYDFKY